MSVLLGKFTLCYGPTCKAAGTRVWCGHADRLSAFGTHKYILNWLSYKDHALPPLPIKQPPISSRIPLTSNKLAINLCHWRAISPLHSSHEKWFPDIALKAMKGLESSRGAQKDLTGCSLHRKWGIEINGPQANQLHAACNHSSCSHAPPHDSPLGATTLCQKAMCHCPDPTGLLMILLAHV